MAKHKPPQDDHILEVIGFVLLFPVGYIALILTFCL